MSIRLGKDANEMWDLLFGNPDAYESCDHAEQQRIKTILENKKSPFVFHRDHILSKDVKDDYIAGETFLYNQRHAEEEFLQTRSKVVNQSLSNLKIGVCTSGGGLRAMIESAAFTQSLLDTQLLNECDYFAGLSGSTWFLSTFLSAAIHKKVSLQNYIDNLTKSPLVLSPTFERMKNAFKAAWIKRNLHNSWSYVDIWAEMFVHVNKALCEVDRPKLSELGSFHNFPFPIFTAVEQNKKIWYEATPFSISRSDPEAYCIPSKFFHSKWNITDRKSIKSYTEDDLNFHMGVWGSAFCAPLSKFKLPKWIEDYLDLGDKHLFTGPAIPDWETSDPLHLIDAGTIYNLPIVPLVRREVDAIIVYDSSAYAGEAQKGDDLRAAFKALHWGEISEKLSEYQYFPAQGDRPHIFYIPAKHDLSLYDTFKMNYSTSDSQNLYKTNLTNSFEHLQKVKEKLRELNDLKGKA